MKFVQNNSVYVFSYHSYLLKAIPYWDEIVLRSKQCNGRIWKCCPLLQPSDQLHGHQWWLVGFVIHNVDHLLTREHFAHQGILMEQAWHSSMTRGPFPRKSSSSLSRLDKWAGTTASTAWCFSPVEIRMTVHCCRFVFMDLQFYGGFLLLYFARCFIPLTDFDASVSTPWELEGRITNTLNQMSWPKK